MGQGIFITGTDTGVGKTLFTVVLMEELKNRGYSVAGMKPVASGATMQNGQLINDDASEILACCSKPTDYELINPFVFEPPIAPHIAAKEANRQIDINIVTEAYRFLEENNDIVVVEGVGGWRVPISTDQSLKDLVGALNIPALLVVGLRLGCINHALLTAEVIRSDGLELGAWAANRMDREYTTTASTMQSLADRIPAPCIAEIPYLEKSAANGRSISFDFSEITDFIPA